jgi:hypothetical protein
MVATACQTLVGLGAVATSASWQRVTAHDAAAQKPPRDRGGNNTTDVQRTPADTSAGDAATSTPAPLVAPGARQGVPGGTATNSGALTPTTSKDGTKSKEGTTTTTAAPPSGPKCPHPKTCDIFKVFDETNGGPAGGTKGWRPGADGIVRVPFHANTTPPPNSGLTEETMEAAIRAGTKIIEAANPRIRLDYQGRTPPERVPRQFDGFNDFGFGDRTIPVFDGEGYIREADIRPTAMVAGSEWAYTPCEQRDDSCTPTGGKAEILGLLLHEEMHAVGLADLSGPETKGLTMNSDTEGGGDRHLVTLGLGDVLGLRHLYPTTAPMPTIYTP